MSCLLGRLKLAQYSFAWVRNEGHMLERAPLPQSLWAAECPGTEEKVPYTSTVSLAKPQPGAFGTHGHTGAAPRYGLEKSGCGFSPPVHGLDVPPGCQSWAPHCSPVIQLLVASQLPLKLDCFLLGYGWATGSPPGPAGPCSRDKTNHKRHLSC